MSYKLFGEDLRSKVSKREEKDRNFRGYVGSTDMASLLNFSKSSVLPRVGRKNR
jgi:hypothetical protein